MTLTLTASVPNGDHILSAEALTLVERLEPTLLLTGWATLIAVLIGFLVNATFFLMFEVWFKVPLPKGPIEALLGFQ